MKTAARILGNAFFLEGFDVQDAPRYGAERRGAPIFAYVRAAKSPILERGVIGNPDLVVVADETLVPIPAAGVLAGCDVRTVLLTKSTEVATVWKERLNYAGPIVALPVSAEAIDSLEIPFISAICAGAAARLVGVVSRVHLEQAISEEAASFGEEVLAKNLERALASYDAMSPYPGIVSEGVEVAAHGYIAPEWIDLPFEEAHISAPHIHAATTSVEVRTGLWRTMRPVIDYERCNRCIWVCSTLCPDSAIGVDAQGAPQIDYDHCKGCLVCVAVCPPHAIHAIPERAATEQEAA